MAAASRPRRVQDYDPTGKKDEEIWYCAPASWGQGDWSVKYAHRNRSNGHWARSGEFPLGALPFTVVGAARRGYLDRAQITDLIQSLVDVLDPAQIAELAHDLVDRLVDRRP